MNQQPRATFNRKPDRGSYEREDVYSILDTTFLCHVGFVIDGEARVLPTAYVRIGDAVYLHGHLRNQMLRTLLNGQVACVTVTLLDSLVLARSGFHHSVNYRSAVVFGRAEEVTTDDKGEILNALVDHMVPNRSATLRPNSEQELNATLLIKIPIAEASAKSRNGPPSDLESDYALDIWAGTINVTQQIISIEDCPRQKPNLTQPQHIQDFITT